MLSFPNSCEKTFFWSFRVHLKIKWCNDHKLGITKFWTNQRWLGRKFSCLPFQSVLYSEMNNISAENVCPHSAHLSMYFQAQLCVKHQFSQWYLLEAWKIFCSFLSKRESFQGFYCFILCSAISFWKWVSWKNIAFGTKKLHLLP